MYPKDTYAPAGKTGMQTANAISDADVDGDGRMDRVTLYALSTNLRMTAA